MTRSNQRPAPGLGWRSSPLPGGGRGLAVTHASRLCKLADVRSQDTCDTAPRTMGATS